MYNFENFPTCCLSPLPKLACSTHATWCIEFSRSLYFDTLTICAQSVLNPTMVLNEPSVSFLSNTGNKTKISK